MRVGLKWPNDLWLMDAPAQGRKLGGVLIETVIAGRARLAVVGVGLNVLPMQASDASTGFASLHELDARWTAPAVLHHVTLPLVQALRRFEAEGFGAFRDDYARRDLLAGQTVRTTQQGAPEGIGRGVDERGALQLDTPDGRRVAIHSGEVSVRLGAG